MIDLNIPWEQIPFSFRFPYACVKFLGPEGYIDGYFLDYFSFTPLDEDAFFGKIPFNRFMPSQFCLSLNLVGFSHA